MRNANLDPAFIDSTGLGFLSYDRFPSTACQKSRFHASLSPGQQARFLPLPFIEGWPPVYPGHLISDPCSAQTRGFLLDSCPSFITWALKQQRLKECISQGLLRCAWTQFCLSNEVLCPLIHRRISLNQIIFMDHLASATHTLTSFFLIPLVPPSPFWGWLWVFLCFVLQFASFSTCSRQKEGFPLLSLP